MLDEPNVVDAPDLLVFNWEKSDVAMLGEDGVRSTTAEPTPPLPKPGP